MITIICATHRPKNQTKAVVEAYLKILKEDNGGVNVLEMSTLPKDFAYNGIFGSKNDLLDEIVHHKIVPADKFIVISPEYNGSFPGIFKTFIDVIDPAVWKSKKIALVGVASGRAGNLRGMDHLTSIFHYLKAEVFSNKLPISSIDAFLSEAGELNDMNTLKLLKDQAEAFKAF